MFDPASPDLDWLGAWITGRALARGLPAPFRDSGGWRAEIGLDNEKRRWLFPGISPALLELANRISDPGNNLRVFCETEDLRAALPPGWVVGSPSFAMTRAAHSPEPRLPAGFRLDLRYGRYSAHVAILTCSGELAASGHAGIGPEAVVYDRIVTHPQFYRKGLGTSVMHALGNAPCDPALPQILVATEAGRKLYETLGWQVVSPYASANRVA